jgi:hypothetical protein
VKINFVATATERLPDGAERPPSAEVHAGVREQAPGHSQTRVPQRPRSVILPNRAPGDRTDQRHRHLRERGSPQSAGRARRTITCPRGPWPERTDGRSVSMTGTNGRRRAARWCSVPSRRCADPSRAAGIAGDQRALQAWLAHPPYATLVRTPVIRPPPWRPGRRPSPVRGRRAAGRPSAACVPAAPGSGPAPPGPTCRRP